MKKQFGKNGIMLLLPLLFSAAHVLLVARRDLVTFQWDVLQKAERAGILCLAGLFVYGFYFLLCRCVLRLIRREEKLVKALPFFVFYALVMGVLWLLTWPGIFKGDEFYVIKAALSFQFSAMQGGLTSLFYILSLLFFPSMASIVFFQLLLICAVFAIVMRDLFSRFQTRLRFLLFLPFLLPPVLDGNLFTLRATPTGWLFLLLLDKILMAKTKDTREWKKAPGLFVIALLCGLLPALRSEMLYLIVFVPATLLLLKKNTLRQAAGVLLLSVLLWQVFGIPNKIAANGQNKYPISLVLNPLANLFTHAEELKGPQVYEDIMTVNELVDAQLLRQNASVRNISQYWNIPDVLPKEQLSRFMKASLRLIVYNPGLFFHYRWQTFAYTNGFYPGYINHPGGEDTDAIRRLSYYGTDYGSFFAFSRPPFGWGVRDRVISALACRIYEKDRIRTDAALPVFYNVLPVCILLLLCFAICLASKRKKNRETAALILLCLLQFPLIFLTAPAMFFMYYFCLYLCGWVLIMVTVAGIADRRRIK